MGDTCRLTFGLKSENPTTRPARGAISGRLVLVPSVSIFSRFAPVTPRAVRATVDAIVIAFCMCIWAAPVNAMQDEPILRLGAEVDSRGIAANNASAADEKLDPELEKYIRELLAAVSRKSAKDFNACIDWETMLQRAFADLPDSEALRAFREGFLQAIEGPGGLPATVVDAVANGGTLTFLRCLNRDDQLRALFRLTLPDGGFNYLELSLDRNAEGHYRTVDVYTYSIGEQTSATLRRAYLPFASEKGQDVSAQLEETESLIVAHVKEYSRFAELVSAGEAERAMEIYHELPEELQNEKTALLLRLRATQQLGDAEYEKALNAIRERYPQDPSGDLLSIDAYLLDRQYEQAIECIDRLDQRVQGDPYLDLQRAAVMILKEDWDAAERYAKQALVDENCQLNAHWTLVSISLGRKQPAQTLALLKQMDQKFEMKWSDLRTVEGYEPFVESAYYQDWLEYLRLKDGK